jgi:hypothetical protein
MEVIGVTRISTNQTFCRAIPARYMFHLLWMLQEAHESPSEMSGWLMEVLDKFVEEVSAHTEDFSGWRSRVLNPVLIRTMDGAKHTDSNHVQMHFLRNHTYAVEKPVHTDWAEYYSHRDPVAPNYDHTWNRMKKIAQPNNGSFWSSTQGAHQC